MAEWTRILTEINYWPIFSIAREIVRPLREQLASKLLTRLSATASDLAADGVTQSHDLYGRLFQRLIADRKYLATFYTLPSSALLLAETAVAMLDHVDWQDPASIRSLRIADFACGTGTLIASACSAVYARHRRHGGDDAALHAAMMEKSLIACDIMPAATHLAAAMLSSLHPTVTFGATQIHTLPYGERPDGTGTTIGALDLIDSQSGVDLFGDNLGRQMHGKKSGDLVGAEAVFEEGFALHHESVDLVIMNPPFTRPTNHEGNHSHIPVPSFAGFSTDAREQRAMAERLKVLRGGLGRVAGHGNAGLASNFIDLAHVKLKQGGVMAMVVPLAFAQGASWRPARELISRHYSNIKVLSIAQAGTHARSFSSDTGMGEVLVIARKKELTRQSIHWISLRKRPESNTMARVLARRIVSGGIVQGSGERLRIGRETAAICLFSEELSGGRVGISDPCTVQTASGVVKGVLDLPRLHRPVTLPIIQLGELGERGPLDRDINGTEQSGKHRGPFDIEEIQSEIPTYPVLWAHNIQRERTLTVAPDREGFVRSGMRDQAKEIWSTACRLHFNRDFRLNSQSLVACLTEEATIGGRAWPSFQLQASQFEEILCLWANTTLGLVAFWWQGTTQQAGRVGLTLSRLPTLPVLDPRCLDTQQLEAVAKLFAEFKGQEFRPANEAYRDDVRQALDQAVLVDVLGLSREVLGPLSNLRDKWCAEPSVHGGKATRIESARDQE